MAPLNFIAALYNEEAEVEDLIDHISPYVEGLYFADDGSTDKTRLLLLTSPQYPDKVHLRAIEHTGLCEVARIKALETVPDGSWVLMLDADERFAPGVLEDVKAWLRSIDSTKYTHVYFFQEEIIDGVSVRAFQKVKLFRKDSAHLPEMIHADPQFDGDGIYKGEWVVFHRKTSDKQKQREREYLDTYQKLFEEGKIDDRK